MNMKDNNKIEFFFHFIFFRKKEELHRIFSKENTKNTDEKGKY